MQNFTELYEVERRYEELAHKMSTPDAAADAEAYAQMMRDYKELTPLIEEYRRYTDLQQQEQDAKEMLAAESDPAFAAMVQQELCEIGRNLAQSEENLRLLLIPKDPQDSKNAIVEIRGGTGGVPARQDHRAGRAVPRVLPCADAAAPPAHARARPPFLAAGARAAQRPRRRGALAHGRRAAYFSHCIPRAAPRRDVVCGPCGGHAPARVVSEQHPAIHHRISHITEVSHYAATTLLQM